MMMVMPYKDSNKQKEYQQGWYQRKKAGLPTRTTNIPTEESIRKKKNLREMRYRKNLRKKINKIFGDECFICGRKDIRLICHETTGKSHKYNGNQSYRYALKHKEIMVRLCYMCHKSTHWIMEHFRWKWGQIITQTRKHME